jgi:hypothetical protein
MTRVWLAQGIEPGSDVIGKFLLLKTGETRVNELVHDAQAQDRLLASYAKQTGMPFPEGS